MRQRNSDFFENRLSKPRFLSLPVMRGFFATTKNFSYKRRGSCAIKSEGKFLKKVWYKGPLNTDKGYEVFFQKGKVQMKNEYEQGGQHERINLQEL